MIKVASLVLVGDKGEVYPGPVSESIVPLENAARKIRVAGQAKIGKDMVKIAQAIVLSNFRPALRFRC